MHRSTVLWATAAFAGAAFACPTASAQHRPDRFRAQGSVENGVPGGQDAPGRRNLAEAPAGFDSLTNGYLPQGPDFDTLDEDNVVAGRSFNDNRFIFEEAETNADGLGPVYNAQSCRECHQN